ncbi:riboflavin kinase/FMN adenylyltransferase [Thermonema lapsum]|uniref:Riboflavin biosynthesis protein n=1 Tax=Thermonema lapsum TaxID=28195 RepID=A0A846MQ71_9BACT|nr:bifunctional riboflavin kinase/FAD synthetase [Thermonema lapsum]NIK73736.1 riboflavin kinase/FMN adenylyltransferase [Thermonema lapsum]
MRVYHNLHDYQPARPTVVTTGTFDGVHQGHRRIMARLRKAAQERNTEAVVITFWPHPRMVLGQEVELLNTIEEKTERIRQEGIDALIVLPFTEDFARLMPEEYIEKIYVRGVHAGLIVIGYDHHFGYQRQGDIHLLRQLAPRYGFEVEEIPAQEIDDLTVSSTKIRRALKEGNIELANQLLGYAYTLHGTVVHGDKIGRTLGFPTANLKIEASYKLIPAAGIYAAYAYGEHFERKQALVYIGNRPTLSKQQERPNIEVFLLDFAGELYQSSLRVEFLKKLRDDQKFDSLESLQNQIQKDYQQALSFFNAL